MGYMPNNTWDVFIAHAGADVVSARHLANCLTSQHRLTCFLDAQQLQAGNVWPTTLKNVLAQSRVVVVIVSENSDAAYYLQEEVAIAVAISRAPSSSIRIIPVLLRGATQRHLPYGTFTLHALYEDRGGWPPVVDAIAQEVDQSRQRSRSTILGGAVEGTDEMWSRLEPPLTAKGARLVVDYDMRYRADGDAMVALNRSGREVQRVTREQLADRLPQNLMHHIEVLERSMEINKAIWDEKYPRRVLDKTDRELAQSAMQAVADDFRGVIDTIETAGFWLDDHYVGIRQMLKTMPPPAGV